MGKVRRRHGQTHVRVVNYRVDSRLVATASSGGAPPAPHPGGGSGPFQDQEDADQVTLSSVEVKKRSQVSRSPPEPPSEQVGPLRAPTSRSAVLVVST